MKFPEPRNDPWTEKDKESLLRFLLAWGLVFVILAVVLGIQGYYAPYLSFQNYLKELPAGMTSKFNPATYEFYFRGSYLVQVIGGMILIPIMVYFMLIPKDLMKAMDLAFEKLRLDG